MPKHNALKIGEEITRADPLLKFFLTLPQSGNIEKQAFLDALPPTKKYFIVKEKHADGNPHLHALVEFKMKISKAQLIKHFAKTYPNDDKRFKVQKTKNLAEGIKYLTEPEKDKYVDPEPLTNHTVKKAKPPTHCEKYLKLEQFYIKCDLLSRWADLAELEEEHAEAGCELCTIAYNKRMEALYEMD